MTKEALFVAKTVRLTNMERKLFDVQGEKSWKALNIDFYGRSRWSMIKLMFCQVLMVKMEFLHLAPSLIYGRESLNPDPSFELLGKLGPILSSTIFWNGVARVSIVFYSVRKAIGLFEGDSSTTATALRSLIFVRLSFKQAKWIKSTERTHLDVSLVRQPQSILSNVHCLAFRCDLPYAYMCEKLMQILSADFLTIGNLSFIFHCHTLLQSLTVPPAEMTVFFSILCS